MGLGWKTVGKAEIEKIVYRDTNSVHSIWSFEIILPKFSL